MEQLDSANAERLREPRQVKAVLIRGLRKRDCISEDVIASWKALKRDNLLK